MNPKLKILMLASGFAGATSLLNAQPTDNPVDAYYGGGTYAWTAQIAWSTLFDVTQAPYNAVADDGLSDQAAFDAAIADASAAGGGIVYVPAGTYNLDDDLVLLNGVVIRGDTPAPATSSSMWTRTNVDGTPEVLPLATRGDLTALDAPAQRSDYRPQSKLVFPEYIPNNTGSGTPNSTAFKVITVDDPLTARNYGLVNVDINHARVRNFVDVWPTGPFELTNLTASPDLKGGNIILFGIRGNHMAMPDSRVPAGSQHSWQRFQARGAANISLVAYENVLVANNRLNDEITASWDQPDYLMKTGVRPNWRGNNPDGIYTFNYTDLYGIVINRAEAYGNPTPTSMNPDSNPESFRKGIVVRDNFLHNTMRVGYHIAGQDAQVIDNIKIDLPGKATAIHPDGQKQHKGETLENRGIDIGGFNVTVSGNHVPVWSHIAYTSTQTLGGSVDGEAILQQAHATSLTRAVTINNNHVRGYIGIYKVRDIESLSISGNRIFPGSWSRQTGKDNIWVQADDNGSANYYMRDSSFDGNILNSDDQMHVIASGGIDNVSITNTTAASNLKYTDGISLSGNSFTSLTMEALGFTYNPRPVVTLSGVSDGATVAAPVTLTATAADADGVDRVEFWSNGIKLGEDTTAPYELAITGSEGDCFNVFARAIESGTGRENFSHQSLAFVLGAAPVEPSFHLTMAPGPGPDEHTIGFEGTAGVTYELKMSTTLSGWTDAGEAPILSTGGSESFTVEATGTTFYRVVGTP